MINRFPALRLVTAETVLPRQGVLVERCYERLPVRTGATRAET
ncbi:hypothetical protein [Streptomyces sp. NPDC086838]